MASVFSDPVFWTAALGIAGILAAFFAPPWTARQVERRREAREFRRATRLVADELQAAAEALRFVLQKTKTLPGELTTFFELPSWEAERGVLATSLERDVWRTVSHTVEGMVKGRIAMSMIPSGAPLDPKALETVRTQAEELDRSAELLLDARRVVD